jgi:peptide/nickel transport system ATP-binding protein
VNSAPAIDLAQPAARSAPVTLEVKDLRVHFEMRHGPVKAVDGVGFALRARQKLGLVGESGSGKSTIALALMRLVRPPGRVVSGRILLDGTNLLDLSEEQMRRVRLARIALVTQGAMNSLNPVLRIRDQVRDGLKDHDERLSGQEFKVRLESLLDRVGLPRRVASMYPHELSGGMKQRVCIAVAISLRPKVIIADEPTSALDVLVQRQIMDTLWSVQEELGASSILIGHDMGLMAQAVDTVGVMYSGKLVEIGSVRDVFAEPLHPYTQNLIDSLPSLERKPPAKREAVQPPSRVNQQSAAPFVQQCPVSLARCALEDPPLREIKPNHWVACHLY